MTDHHHEDNGTRIAHEIEGRLNHGEKPHSALHDELHKLQKLDSHHGVINADKFKHDVHSVETKLHKDGYLPHLHIAVDHQSHIKISHSNHEHANSKHGHVHNEHDSKNSLDTKQHGLSDHQKTDKHIDHERIPAEHLKSKPIHPLGQAPDHVDPRLDRKAAQKLAPANDVEQPRHDRLAPPAAPAQDRVRPYELSPPGQVQFGLPRPDQFMPPRRDYRTSPDSPGNAPADYEAAPFSSPPSFRGRDPRADQQQPWIAPRPYATPAFQPPTNFQDRLPPNFHRDRLPPNLQQDRLPPNFQQDRLPPNFQQDRLPPNFQQDRLPPNFQQDRLPPNFQQDRLPPNFQQDRLPPNFQQDRLPPNFQQDRLPPNFQPNPLPEIEPGLDLRRQQDPRYEYPQPYDRGRQRFDNNNRPREFETNNDGSKTTGEFSELRLQNSVNGRGSADALVYVRQDFDPSKPIHLAVYNHGFGSTVSSALPRDQIKEMMSHAEKNTVLVLPEWQYNPGSRQGSSKPFQQQDKFTNMLQEAMQKSPALQGASLRNIDRIDIIAHSAGYSPTEAEIYKNPQLANKVHSITLLDSLYDRHGFDNWLSANIQDLSTGRKQFYNFSNSTTDANSRAQAQFVGSLLRSRGLPTNNFQTDYGGAGGDQVARHGSEMAQRSILFASTSVRHLQIPGQYIGPTLEALNSDMSNH